MQRSATFFKWLLIVSIFASYYGIEYMASDNLQVPVREKKIINGDRRTGGSSLKDVTSGDTEERQRSINSVKMKDSQIHGKTVKI